MANIFFKASRRKSGSCDSYRQIEKSGNTEFDITGTSDDVITLYTENHKRISIDCDKKTGTFRLFFEDGDFIKN